MAWKLLNFFHNNNSILSILKLEIQHKNNFLNIENHLGNSIDGLVSRSDNCN